MCYYFDFVLRFIRRAKCEFVNEYFNETRSKLFLLQYSNIRLLLLVVYVTFTHRLFHYYSSVRICVSNYMFRPHMVIIRLVACYQVFRLFS